MPRPQRQKGGSKKQGRDKVKCQKYRANKTREKNKLRRLKKQVQSKAVLKRISELKDYISNK